MSQDTETLFSSTNEIANILVSIDTDAILKKYPNLSQTQTSPTMVGASFFYLLLSGKPATSGQGTSNLTFTAKVGDALRIYATSGTHNFDDAILLYKLVKLSGDDVFNNFNSNTYTRTVCEPSSTILPATIVERDFYFYESTFKKKGVITYDLHCALYTRESGDLKLKGYFRIDPKITVTN